MKTKPSRASERLADSLSGLRSEQQNFVALKDDYLENLKALNYAERTVFGRDDMLSVFLLWCFDVSQSARTARRMSSGTPWRR